MTFHELNLLPHEQLKQELLKCCASIPWVNKMIEFFPMEDLVELLEDAEEQWYLCTETEWKQALNSGAGPEHKDSFQDKVSATGLAADELKDITQVSAEDKEALLQASQLYANKFGYKFTACDPGTSAAARTNLIHTRLQNEPGIELGIAAEEQVKIIHLRIQTLLQ